MAEFLISSGANPEAKDKDGNNPIHNFVRGKVRGGVEVFIRRGIVSFARNDAGLNVLLVAIIARNHHDVSLLCTNHPCLINSTNPRCHTALHLAVQLGEFNFVRELVERGANLEFCDNHGRTPLHHAAVQESLDTNIIHYLLGQGANIDARDNDESTPLDLTTPNIFSIFIKRGTCATQLKPDKLPNRAWRGDVDYVAELLQLGIPTETRDKFGQTALLLAAGRGSPSHLRIAKLLLSHGGDPNTRSENGAFPLLVAARSGHFDMCKLLLRYRSDISMQNVRGKTALEVAREEEVAGRRGPLISEVVRLLERHELGCVWFVGLEGGTGELVRVVESEVGTLGFKCR